MSNGSSLLGSTFLDSDGIINLSINGNGSYWQLTGNSSVTGLHLDNSFVDLTNGNVSLVSPTVLNIANLSGNGTFFQRLDISGNDSLALNNGDLIVVNNASSGSYVLTFDDSLSGNYTLDDTSRLLVVQQNASGGTYNASYKGQADIGAYVYSVVVAEGGSGDQNYYLMLPPLAQNTSIVCTNAACASIGFLHINYLSNFINTETLLQRLGELGQNRTTKDDVWVKTYGGRLNSFKEDTKIEDVKYYGIQLGADRLYDNDYTRSYLGFTFGYSNSDVDYVVGDGKSKSFYGGLYAAVLFPVGSYIDFAAKYIHNQNRFDTLSSNNYTVSGKGDTKGVSFSIEAGHKIDVQNTSLYLEPQVQFSYNFQQGATIDSSNGLRTRLDAYDSYLGRVGIILGYKVKNSTNIYYKTGYIKEFDGKAEYYFNDDDAHKKEFRLNSNIFDNALGLTYSSGLHNFYVEGTYQLGDEFDNIKGNLGYRLEF
jgi:outer membrane autotransporter protein